MGAPVIFASMTAPFCAMCRGPRGPSGTISAFSPVSRITRASVRSARGPPRDEEPRTTRMPKPCTNRLRISPSRERLVSAWSR